MLQIDNKKNNYLLDLNEVPYDSHTINIKSVDDKGNRLSWGIEFISSDKIQAHANGIDELIVETPLDSIKTDEYILLRNYAKERLRVDLKPNLEAIRPKSYKFKISSKKTDGRNVKIKILSKDGNNEVPWECSYDGKPLTYTITPFSSEIGEHVKIEPRGDIFGEIETVIRFTQSKSGNEIELKLKQSNDSVEIIKAD
jgi:hypothetical protein